MNENNFEDILSSVMSDGDLMNKISGIVKFYNTPYKGIIISAEFFHLPPYTPSNIPSFYGFHIHEKGDCSNNFANTGGHYNPLEIPGIKLPAA